jgi:hypothetical protein
MRSGRCCARSSASPPAERHRRRKALRRCRSGVPGRTRGAPAVAERRSLPRAYTGGNGMWSCFRRTDRRAARTLPHRGRARPGRTVPHAPRRVRTAALAAAVCTTVALGMAGAATPPTTATAPTSPLPRRRRRPSTPAHRSPPPRRRQPPRLRGPLPGRRRRHRGPRGDGPPLGRRGGARRRGPRRGAGCGSGGAVDGAGAPRPWPPRRRCVRRRRPARRRAPGLPTGGAEGALPAAAHRPTPTAPSCGSSPAVARSRGTGAVPRRRRRLRPARRRAVKACLATGAVAPVARHGYRRCTMAP